jgi:hypothetical protein
LVNREAEYWSIGVQNIYQQGGGIWDNGKAEYRSIGRRRIDYRKAEYFIGCRQNAESRKQSNMLWILLLWYKSLSSTTLQRTAYSVVSSQVTTHLRI